MEAIRLDQQQRTQLVEMAKTLVPEYKHVHLGGEYVSFSNTESLSLDIYWDRIHWLELLLKELVRRVYSLGRHDRAWLDNITRKIVLSLMAPEVDHPVSILYEEYLKALPKPLSDEQMSETA